LATAIAIRVKRLCPSFLLMSVTCWI